MELDQHCGTLIFMAPEVAFKKQYSKSVDIWAVGIIMYMLLTGGKHPLYNDKDTAETYKHRLANADELTFPSHLSGLAKNLFMRLTKRNSSQRYSLENALNHPWITRINKTGIPLTFQEQVANMQTEGKLRDVVRLMFFAAI